MRKLIDRYEMLVPIRLLATEGKPMFGTCAGLILLAQKLVGYGFAHIGAMEATVARNSFGRQVDSFETNLDINRCCKQYSSSFYSCAAYCIGWRRCRNSSYT